MQKIVLWLSECFGITVSPVLSILRAIKLVTAEGSSPGMSAKIISAIIKQDTKNERLVGIK